MVWSAAMLTGERGKEREGRITVGEEEDVRLATERGAGVTAGRRSGARVGTERDDVHQERSGFDWNEDGREEKALRRVDAP